MSTKRYSRFLATAITACMMITNTLFPSTAYAVETQDNILNSDISSDFELPDIVVYYYDGVVEQIRCINMDGTYTVLK